MSLSGLNLCKSLLLREERTVGKNQNVFSREIRKYSIELGERVSRGSKGVGGEGVSYLGTNFERVIQLRGYRDPTSFSSGILSEYFMGFITDNVTNLGFKYVHLSVPILSGTL